MIKFLNRIIPYLVPIIIFILLKEIVFSPKQIYLLAFVSLLILGLSIWQLTERNLFRPKFWQFAITPVLLLASGLFFLSFLEGYLFRQFFIIILAVLIWAFLELTYLRFHLRLKYQVHALENISTYINLITVFLTVSSFFGLIIFLDFSFWILTTIFAVLIILLNYQIAYSSEAPLNSSWLYILAITLMMIEIFWSVNFLPTSIYVNGLVVTISYYLMSGLARNWLLGIQERKVVLRYLVISFISLIIILVTAKWF